MKLSGSRQSKNVDDIRKQKPKVKSAPNTFGEPPEDLVKKGNKVALDGTVTGRMQESKKKAAPMKPAAAIGKAVGRDAMEGAQERDNRSRAAAKEADTSDAMKNLFAPKVLNDSIFPKEFK